MNQEVQDILDTFQELQEDSMVSKNIKSKVANMKAELEKTKEEELSLIANKIIYELEELSNDVNLPADVRTRLFSITTVLERI
ncbi:UPF0147 family protein [Candidatus Woesearchaeota archaeon]|nr:UPF0147 family protein [Candidatus Woesearchaeota archaeon]MCF7901339.1 UPF0147 family protein [Candidatus Woesearchaeota archaeon]MCF8014036.1 UPF0147 family protein [Candidatus Woesearchaeota archaeon]